METRPSIVRPDKEEEKTFVAKLSDFISKNRVAFISAVAVVFAVILAAGIYTFVTSSIVEKSSRAMEEAQTSLASWNQESDETKKAELEKELVGKLDSIVAKWPKSFAAQQALFLKAGLLASKKEWAEAEKTALDAANRRSSSYLAPVALESAAVSAEEQGNADAAYSYYTRIVNDYKNDNPALPHAYFSLGRLSEAKSDWKTALSNYETLTSSYAGSDWSLLAKDRVIFLKSQGLDK